MRVLFVCSRNRLRSPTAEDVFRTWPEPVTAMTGAEIPAPYTTSATSDLPGRSGPALS